MATLTEVDEFVLEIEGLHSEIISLRAENDRLKEQIASMHAQHMQDIRDMAREARAEMQEMMLHGR